MSRRYQELLLLARLEQRLVDEGRFDELEELGERWEAVASELPDPTPEDRKLLEEIELTLWTTVAQVRLSLEDTARMMSLVDRGRRAIGTYGGAAVQRAVNASG